MSTALRIRLVTTCGSLLLLSSCSQVAVTGRKQLNLMPASVMHSLSYQSYSEFLSQNRLSSNTQQTEMVKRIGLRIQKAVEQYCAANNMSDRLEGYKWEFNLVEDPSANAWCMAGGKVVVHTGLLPVARDDTGLAVVMGHEIAHAIAKHGAERMTQGLIVDFGGKALSTVLANKPEQTKALFMKSYGVGTQYGVLMPYSRVHESEADHLGLIFMSMAGYDPREALNFWERMAVVSKGEPAPLEILSTHPSDATRIKNIKARLPEAIRYYEVIQR